MLVTVNKKVDVQIEEEQLIETTALLYRTTQEEHIELTSDLIEAIMKKDWNDFVKSSSEEADKEAFKQVYNFV